MYFNNIILVGSGRIACDCVEVLCRNNVSVKVLETQNSMVSMLRDACKKNGISYANETEREEITKKLLSTIIEHEPILIISANNEYLFPKKVLEKVEVTIINFHYSYLPDYRGMNIPTWVIYNNEKYTGITWHYVNDKVDAGDIIVQKKIELHGMETALDIVRAVMEKGKEAFEEFIFSFLDSPIKGKKNYMPEIHEYKRTQLPAEGILDVSLGAEQIIRLLRAYDYGPMEIIPRLKILIDGAMHEIKKYRVIKDDSIFLGKNNWEPDISIKKDSYCIQLKIK